MRNAEAAAFHTERKTIGMTDKEKDIIVKELKDLTENYFRSLKDVLVKNDLVYSPECKYEPSGIPFDGIMPKVNIDMLEDLSFDIVNHSDTLKYELHEKEYVEKKIAEYEDYHSPKSRIKRHMSEIERLKEKYHVTDEDLK